MEKETKKDLKTLLKENEIHYPKVWTWLYVIAIYSAGIAMLLFLITPLIKYGNGTNITKDETYSIFKLINLENGNLILFLMTIIFVGIACPIFVSIGVFGYVNSYFAPAYKKTAAKPIKLLTSKKLQKFLIIVGTIITVIGIGLLLSLIIFVMDFKEFDNPYWEVHIAWGTYVTLIFTAIGLSCAVTPLLYFIVYKKQYENDHITDEQVLALFQKKQKDQN